MLHVSFLATINGFGYIEPNIFIIKHLLRQKFH